MNGAAADYLSVPQQVTGAGAMSGGQNLVPIMDHQGRLFYYDQNAGT